MTMNTINATQRNATQRNATQRNATPNFCWVPCAVFQARFFTREDVVSQRLKFGSAFLSSSWESKIVLFFLTFPYPVPVPKNCVIFIGCNFKSRASQVGLHKEKKHTASAKKGKVSLQRRGGGRLNRGTQRQFSEKYLFGRRFEI